VCSVVESDQHRESHWSCAGTIGAHAAFAQPCLFVRWRLPLLEVRARAEGLGGTRFEDLTVPERFAGIP
jgi:hypothetical protein